MWDELGGDKKIRLLIIVITMCAILLMAGNVYLHKDEMPKDVDLVLVANVLRDGEEVNRLYHLSSEEEAQFADLWNNIDWESDYVTPGSELHSKELSILYKMRVEYNVPMSSEFVSFWATFYEDNIIQIEPDDGARTLYCAPDGHYQPLLDFFVEELDMDAISGEPGEWW